MNNLKDIIFNNNLSIEEKAEAIINENFSELHTLRSIYTKEYVLIRAIIEAFIIASDDLLSKNKWEVHLKDVYKYIDKAHPEIEDMYYHNNAWWLHWYIRYIIQKYTRWSTAYLKVNEWDRVHLFTTYWSWKWKYIFKDLLDESENDLAIEKRTDITIEELQSKTNELLVKYQEFKDFHIVFCESDEDISIHSKIEKDWLIIIYIDKDFQSKLLPISKKIREITEDFVWYISSEIAIQICCNSMHAALIWYKTEYRARILMKNFNQLREILHPIIYYRII